MSFQVRLSTVLLLCLAVLSISAVGPAVARDPAAMLRKAVLQGRPMSLSDVSDHHCHDRAYPVIRCFATRAARDRDLNSHALVRDWHAIT